MFEKNDKSLVIIRKIFNVAIFVLMCACVIGGIVLIAMAFGEYVFYVSLFAGGIATLLLGPIFMQIIWLLADIKFQSILDIKIIRNTQYGLSTPELPYTCFKKCGKNAEVAGNEYSTFDTLKRYKELVDAGIISKEEFEAIKAQLLNKQVSNTNQVETTIEKIKKLKSYSDENIITPEEFAEEKAKILKK